MELAANYSYTFAVDPLCRKCLVLQDLLAVCQEFWNVPVAGVLLGLALLSRHPDLPS